MKRASTILAALCLGVTAFAAKPVNFDIATNLKVAPTPENAQVIRAKNAEARARILKGDYTEGEDFATRQWIDKSGAIWEFSLLVDGQRINEMLRFSNDKGETIEAKWDDLPFYHATAVLTKRLPTDDSRRVYVTFELCWPSRYIFDQIFTYEGERTDKNAIPIDKRDYSLTPASVLCNSKEFCKVFRESTGAGFESEDGGKSIAYYTMLPNEMLEMPCLYDFEVGYTQLDESHASTITFNGYEPETGYMDESNKMYIAIPSGTRNIRNQYQGTARVEGFEPTSQTLPEFGDLHLFNTGLQSSELFGDDMPYTKPFDELTAFYITIADKNLLWNIDPAATKFDPEAIINGGLDLPEGTDLDPYANLVQGYAYADAKYAKDTNLDPREGEFLMPVAEQLYDEKIEEWYVSICPDKNGLIPYGQKGGWSETYGLSTIFENTVDLLAANSRLGWGTTEGFVLDGVNNYFKSIKATSVGDVIYHYNPDNMQDVRVFPLVGTTKWEWTDWVSGVEGIVADEAPAAKVVAANGVIAVTPAEAANVAVFSLSGACVKNVKAAAGATVNVNADKGIYVVVVNGKASKVIL